MIDEGVKRQSGDVQSLEESDVNLYCEAVKEVSKVSAPCEPLSTRPSRTPRQMANPLRVWGIWMFVVALYFDVEVFVKAEHKVIVR